MSPRQGWNRCSPESDHQALLTGLPVRGVQVRPRSGEQTQAQHILYLGSRQAWDKLVLPTQFLVSTTRVIRLTGAT